MAMTKHSVESCAEFMTEITVYLFSLMVHLLLYSLIWKETNLPTVVSTDDILVYSHRIACVYHYLALSINESIIISSLVELDITLGSYWLPK